MIDYMDVWKQQKELEMEMKHQCAICRKLFMLEDGVLLDSTKGGEFHCVSCNKEDGAA